MVNERNAMQYEYRILQEKRSAVQTYKNLLHIADAQQANSTDTLIKDILIQIESNNPDTTLLYTKMEQLSASILEALEDNTQQGSSSDLDWLNRVQEQINSYKAMQSALKKYLDLSKQKDSIEELINTISTGNQLPDYDSEESIDEWKNIWKEKFSALRHQISIVPRVNSENNQLLSYDNNRYNIIKELDMLERKHLEDINNLEKGVNYLFSNYNAMAIFAAIFALLLDVFALLVGVTIYLKSAFDSGQRIGKADAISVE